MVDLITNQKVLWKARSPGDDGRTFDSKPLGQSDEPELLQVVLEARAALIEQVPDAAPHIIFFCFSSFGLFSLQPIICLLIISLSCSQSQVADLDDEFAELLLTEYSDNSDAIPSSKVSVK